MPGRMRDFIKDITKHDFLLKFNSQIHVSLMTILQLQMILLELNKGICDIKDRDLNSMYETYKDFNTSSNDAKNVYRILDYLNRMFPNKSPELKRYSTISLFILIMDLMPNYDIKNRRRYCKMVYRFRG